MMEQIEIQRAIEAILFAAGERVDVSRLCFALEADEEKEIEFHFIGDKGPFAPDMRAHLEKLDLSLLSEVKRNDKGTVEIKLIDRLRALEQLAQVAESGGEDLEQFLKALRGTEEHL